MRHGEESESLRRSNKRVRFGRRLLSGWRPGHRVGPFLGLGAVVLVVLFAWDQYREAEARETLYFVFYDYALADTCALVTTAVDRGYRLERERALSRSGLDEASAREMKIQGWVTEILSR